MRGHRIFRPSRFESRESLNFQSPGFDLDEKANIYCLTCKRVRTHKRDGTMERKRLNYSYPGDSDPKPDPRGRVLILKRYICSECGTVRGWGRA